MNRKTVALLPVALLLVSCIQTSLYTLTPEEQAYLDEAKRCPVEFKVSKEASADAWGRAQSFVGRYSRMKLQIATDYVIQTYNPTAGGYGHYITRTPVGDSAQLNVECVGDINSIFSGANLSNNAHILAYYIRTGSPPSERLIAK